MTGEDMQMNADGNSLGASVGKPNSAIMRLLDTKISKDDLPEIMGVKANKSDIEMAFR